MLVTIQPGYDPCRDINYLQNGDIEIYYRDEEGNPCVEVKTVFKSEAILLNNGKIKIV